ncbi:MAG: hypothetical protein U9N52_12325 [Campylobacterota bacterium]|nr:hypothetical protein [Campylobacterota bacterium]
MPKLDKIKEFIGFLKAIFITAIVIFSSLIAYLYDKSLEDNYLVLVALIVDMIIIILLFKKIIKEIDLLEDL